MRGSGGRADTLGEHVLILAAGPAGYAALARTISAAQLRGEKGAPHLGVDELLGVAAAAAGSWFTATGCRKGVVPAALVRDGPAAAQHVLERLVAAFGRDRVLVELWDHDDPLDRPRNDALARLAMRTGIEVIATNNVHYATPDRRRSRPRSPRSGRGAASTSSTAGCPRPRSPICAARPSSSAGSRGTRVRWSAPSTSRPSVRST